MKLIKIIKNKIEIKKLKEEESWLQCFLENKSEAVACLGNEFGDVEEYEKYSKRYSKVVDRIDELESINKKYLGGKYFVLF